MGISTCELNTGDFNNDLTTSDMPGAVWGLSFTGSRIALVAPRGTGAGKMDFVIDGIRMATVDLSTTGERQSQQIVYQTERLAAGKHRLRLVNAGTGPVAIDAVITGKIN
ncbi:MAG TPA: hypothetical protein VK518_20010 [Puia sp.]|nr:hypothetical protein [Puia sp.]